MKVIYFIFLIPYFYLIYGLSPENGEIGGIIIEADLTQTQEYDNSVVKLIETNFDMLYSNYIHFEHSNSPVAPNGDGYFVAFTDKNKYLHVLSYDENDKLLKDFNTKEKAYPVDITAINEGFAIYMIEADSEYHSYLSLYNKSFKLVKTVQIMNNSAKDDKKVDSNTKKQVMRYETNKEPVYGMRFMYHPDSGKLIYEFGRIILIFSHYNYFLDNGEHTGDSTVTFDSSLNNMDFGLTWGASHSLIQSAVADDLYFWTAALSDAYPMGIKVTYTSRLKFKNTKDPVNNKKNQREYVVNENLAGTIQGNRSGEAKGKLGGILYFKKHDIYCLVYAKTPNESDGKNHIYITTWKLENDKITNTKTMTVKTLADGKNIGQVRAGKFGDDKVIITYSEATSENVIFYGDVPKGTTPYLFVIDVLKLKRLKSDVKHNKVIMNTNEDLRTLGNGCLIWATSNKDGKLSIIKIGRE